MVTFCQEEERDFSNTTVVNQEQAWKKKCFNYTTDSHAQHNAYKSLQSYLHFFCRAEVFNASTNPFKYFSKIYLSKSIKKMCEVY